MRSEPSWGPGGERAMRSEPPRRDAKRAPGEAMRSEPSGGPGAGVRCEASPGGVGRGVCDAKRAHAGRCEASPGGESYCGGSGPLGVRAERAFGGSGGSPPREDTASQVAGGPKGLQAWSDAGWLRGQTTRRRIHRRSDGGPERRQVLRRGTRAPLCMLHRNPPLCVKTGLQADLARTRAWVVVQPFPCCFSGSVSWLNGRGGCGPGDGASGAALSAGHPVAPGGM